MLVDIFTGLSPIEADIASAMMEKYADGVQITVDGISSFASHMIIQGTNQVIESG